MDMNMGNIGNKLMERFFRRVDGVVWDLMSGKLGVKCADGIATLEGEGDTAQISINMFDQFGFAIPAFAQNTSTVSVNIGDLVVGSRGIQGWVIEKKDVQLVLMKPDGTRSTMTPPKINMMGVEGGIMVLRSLLNMLPGGSTGLGQMQNMLLPLLMMGDGGSMNFDSIVPLLLMGQMNVTGANPAAGGGMGDMMQMMLMMQMMKGGGVGNMINEGKTRISDPNRLNNFFDRRN